MKFFSADDTDRGNISRADRGILVQMNEDKEREMKLWDHPELFLIINGIFLGTYIIFLLILRLKFKVIFDKSQIACTLLFILTFLCKTARIHN